MALGIYRGRAWRGCPGADWRTVGVRVGVESGSMLSRRRKKGVGPNCRWHKEAGWLHAAVGCSELGRPSQPKKEEGTGRAYWRAGPEARQREGFPFSFSFSNF